MATNDWKERLGMVYSTNPDYEYNKGHEPEAQTPAAEKQALRVGLSKKHRAGKTVTLVSGFVGRAEDLEALAKTLKTRLGVGGSAKDGEIVIQGDFRQRVGEILRAAGYKATKLLMTVLFACVALSAQAQYYSWGPAPASIRWNKMQRGDVKLIYPDYFEDGARRVMWYLDTMRLTEGYGYRHGAMRTPVVVQTQNTIGNGMVMWAPRRMEILAAPAASYSEPWLKQLVAHEYRHNIQYNNLRRGLNRPLMWLLGEQAGFLGVGQFSLYILEGDAVMAETEMSAFGRGLQPSWTMHYRAMGNVGQDRRASDYWFCGSFRDYVPDHYQLGYQMVRWGYDRFGPMFLDAPARYVSRNPQFIWPMAIALKKYYGVTQTGLMRAAFADLNEYWRGLPAVVDSSERLLTRETSYTTYRWPLWLRDSELVAFKSDFDRPSRVVRVGSDGGREKIMTRTGSVSSRPVMADGRMWWTEYRNSALWDERVSSRLVSYDTATDRRRTHRASGEQLFYPVVVGTGGEMAFVKYDYSGRYSIVKGLEGERFRELTTVVEFPFGTELAGLAWDESTHALYFIGLEDSGMFLGAIPGLGWFGLDNLPVSDEVVEGLERFRRLTPSRHITLSDLRASEGWLYFGSIASGRDEAHALEVASGREYRLTSSAFGSFQPSGAVDGKVAVTTYDRHGYHLALQSVGQALPVEPRDLPVDLVNPPYKRWTGAVRFDSLVYSPDPTAAAAPTHKRYRRLPHTFRPHSWIPLDFYPPEALDEADLVIRAGATVMSQNLLSDATAWLSYGWAGRKDVSGAGGSILKGGLSWQALGPLVEVDFTWGGDDQLLYSPIPAAMTLDRKSYFALTGRVSLPLTLGSGYWSSRLTPAAEYYYNNGLIFEGGAIRGTGELTKGVERLMLSLAYSGQTRMAPKEFAPRWGLTARAGWVTNPTNKRFSDVWMASAGVWLPGVVRPHSLRLRGAWQQTGDSPDAPYSFRLKELFPRGAVHDFSARQMASASVDYQLPLWYPEGGIRGVVYFKRIRLNLFGDVARWQPFETFGWVSSASTGGSSATGDWREITSFGGDLLLDISPLRMPATTHCTVRLSVAKPSNRNEVWLGFGLDIPL